MKRLMSVAAVCLAGCVLTEPSEDGFVSIFNGRDLTGWQGATGFYGVRPDEPGVLQCMPEKRNGKEGGGGQLCTTKAYRNFALRFEFCLPPMGNNGLGIRMTDVDKTAAYYAMCELQLLDDNDSEGTTPYQYTGSVYGVFPPRMDNFAKEKDGIPYCPNGSYSFAPGHWNFEDVRVAGEEIEVRLNGVLITKGNLAQYRGDGDTPDGKKHPGLKNKRGFLGWLGHGCNAKWRNIRIREFPDDITMDEMNARLGSAELPLPGEPCTKAAIAPDPFPDRMSAYVWRNWFVVPHDRLAAVVGATESDLEDLAAEMGLPRKVEVLPEWRRKGYITVVRRNWNLLDYPQLLQVVDMTREEMRFSLLEDDFLFVKLGNIKPKCEALLWSAGMRDEGRGKREERVDCGGPEGGGRERLRRGASLHVREGTFVRVAGRSRRESGHWGVAVRLPHDLQLFRRLCGSFSRRRGWFLSGRIAPEAGGAGCERGVVAYGSADARERSEVSRVRRGQRTAHRQPGETRQAV